MRNEFDDELDREKARKERRGSYSKPNPPVGSDNRQGYSNGNRTSGQENMTRRSGDYTRGQNTRPQPANGTRQGMNRNTAQTGTRIQSSSGKSQGTSRQQMTNRNREQIVIGDGRTRQQQRRPESNRQVRGVRSSRSAEQAKKKKKITRFIIMAVAEVLTLALIFTYAYAARLMSGIQGPSDFNKDDVRNDDLTAEQIEHMTGFRTMAIFGVDSRDGNVNSGANADVIIICNINRDTGEIKLVSVFRDTYLNTDDGNVYNKINSAYSSGGPSQALKAINKNLDLDISEYVTFNWKSVADGINMLGGVDIEITKPEFSSINGFITETQKNTGIPTRQLKSAGMQHLDGVQAVAYARLRKMDTDFQRTERQRLIIQKMFDKAKTTDLGVLNRLLLMELEQVGTNLNMKDFTELLLQVNKYHIGDTEGFPFTRGDMQMGKKGDCVIPQTLESNVTELHKLLFDKEDYNPTDTVKKISAKIAADSGMYKNQNSQKSQKSVEETTKSETETTKEETTTESEQLDETDEFGFPIESTDESKETEETVFGETKPDTTKKGEVSPGDMDETEETETKEDGTRWIRPGETRSNRTSPGDFEPSTTASTTDKEPIKSTTDSAGPGVSQTTKASEETIDKNTQNTPETTSDGPGSTMETTKASYPSNTTTPTTSADSEVPVVSAPPG